MQLRTALRAKLILLPRTVQAARGYQSLQGARQHAGIWQVPLALEEYFQRDVTSYKPPTPEALPADNFSGVRVEVHVDDPPMAYANEKICDIALRKGDLTLNLLRNSNSRIATGDHVLTALR
jgi:hypothetical protein